ncbi:MAG: hypothetical protein N2Z62_02960 [Rhodobacteraceae bacterium]|nr:hypothetical protein [Paracoccaceae bacterium]
MPGPRIEKLAFRGGLWQGRLVGLPAGQSPQVAVGAGAAKLSGVEVRPDGAGAWILSVPIPSEALGDGIAVLLVTDAASGERLGEIVLAVGEPAEDDLRAELGLLRAELELLKRAVRRLADPAD